MPMTRTSQDVPKKASIFSGRPGQAGLNGMKLTAQKVNNTGGVLRYKIEVLGQDGKGKPEDSLNALSKLIDEGVITVVGTNFSNYNIPIAPIATAKKIPLLATATSNPKVTVDKSIFGQASIFLSSFSSGTAKRFFKAAHLSSVLSNVD